MAIYVSHKQLFQPPKEVPLGKKLDSWPVRTYSIRETITAPMMIDDRFQQSFPSTNWS